MCFISCVLVIYWFVFKCIFSWLSLISTTWTVSFLRKLKIKQVRGPGKRSVLELLIGTPFRSLQPGSEPNLRIGTMFHRLVSRSLRSPQGPFSLLRPTLLFHAGICQGRRPAGMWVLCSYRVRLWGQIFPQVPWRIRTSRLWISSRSGTG